MKKWVLVGWIVLGLLVAWGALTLSKEAFTICWDGLEVDEALLMEMCGITKEDYYSGNYDMEACPNADDAARMTGGCEPDMPAVWGATGVSVLGYVLFSGVVLVIVRLLRWLFKPPEK